MHKTCIIVAGATAVGKTDLSIELAQAYSTDIISADSRQCYRELHIGVAKPAPADLLKVSHYFIDSHSITEEVSAAGFENYALAAVTEIFNTNEYAIMVGGTGLYIRAFAEGLDQIPTVDASLRQEIRDGYQLHGLPWLQNEIKIKDPLYYATGEAENPQRLMRALEVIMSTGQSINTFRTGTQKQRDFNIIKIGLELPRDILYERINNRVDQMMQAGLLTEAQTLLPMKELNALQTVGYRELFDYLSGKITLNAAVQLIKQHTRHYAKRQMTWFKKDPGFTWFNAADSTLAAEIHEHVEKKIIHKR